MEEYMQLITQLQLPKERWKHQLSSCTSAELTEFLNLTRNLSSLGHDILPAALFAANRLQKSVG